MWLLALTAVNIILCTKGKAETSTVTSHRYHILHINLWQKRDEGWGKGGARMSSSILQMSQDLQRPSTFFCGLTEECLAVWPITAYNFFFKKTFSSHRCLVQSLVKVTEMAWEEYLMITFVSKKNLSYNLGHPQLDCGCLAQKRSGRTDICIFDCLVQ